MAVLEGQLPPDDLVQSDAWNRNQGGLIITDFTINGPADLPFCVFGCLLGAAATPALIESTLIPAIEALPEVTSINGDQSYDQAPAVVENVLLEPVIHISTTISGVQELPVGDFPYVQKSSEELKPPADTKWCTMLARTPALLTPITAATLETAIEGVSGGTFVTQCRVMVYAIIPTQTVGTAAVNVRSHMRLDPIPIP